jgi:anti-sigma factor RsiW
MVPIADVPGCEEVVDRLSELFDGELGEKEAARITLHLAACTGCARFAAELAATIDALHQLHSCAPGPSCALP